MPKLDPSAAQLAADLRAGLARLNRRLRSEVAPNDLSNSQKIALTHLERDGALTVSALARLSAVRPQSMSATISALEAQGLVSASPDPEDGRQMLYALTPACVEYLRTMRAAREDWLYNALTSKLTATQRADLARAAPLIALLAD